VIYFAHLVIALGYQKCDLIQIQDQIQCFVVLYLKAMYGRKKVLECRAKLGKEFPGQNS